MKKSFNSVLNVVLCFLLISCLFGCSSDTPKEETGKTSNNDVQQEQINNEDSIENDSDIEIDNNISNEIEEIVNESEEVVETDLTDKQRNSIAMLNHLTATTQKILYKKNNRLYLEEVYSSLINNTYPNAINDTTLSYINKLLSNISALKINDGERELLQYIYEQRKATEILSALPSPMSVFNVIQAKDKVKTIAGLTYLAFDSITGYMTTKQENSLDYLKKDWELTKNEIGIIDGLRSEGFTFMTKILNENDIKGELSLNEEAIKYITELEEDQKTSDELKINNLIDNEDIYKEYGYYWLLLARYYYNVENYEGCVHSVEKYISIQPQIFRYDYDLANALPLAIASLDSVYSDQELFEKQEEYLKLLIDNTIPNGEYWALRYFAATSYINLYKETNNIEYLRTAYSLVKNNTYNLVAKQKELNTTYLNDVVEEEIPDGTKKEDKERIKKNNRELKEKRKTELPPINVALFTNINLMYDISKELNISDSEINSIKKALYDNDTNLFLVKTINNRYWLSNDSKDDDLYIAEGKELVIPANYVCDNSKIILSLKNSDGTTIIDDFVIKKVKRKNKDVESFIATYTSKTFDDIKLKANDKICIEIYPFEDYLPANKFSYNIKKVNIFGTPKYEIYK